MLFVATMVASVASTATPASAEMGGLHRAAAVLDATLDVYRLALVEIVPAALRLEEAGVPAGAAPSTPAPEPAAEVFKRLAGSVQNRVPAKALPATVRAYHAEVMSALEELAFAATLDGSAASLRNLVRAMRRVTDTGEQVVDLFSRKRPLELRIVDPSTVLDDIGEALDEVAAAERAIAVLRKRQTSFGAQLQAFMRLEVSLGHALDLIAAAEESGIEIGFTVQISTASFGQMLTRVREQLAALDAVVARMERSPPRLPAFGVVVVPAEGERAHAHAAWLAPAAGLPAVVRIYRRPNLDALSERLAGAYVCEGKTAEAAAHLARQDVGELADSWQRVGEEASGRLAYVDALPEMPAAPPNYRGVAVSAFGVESEPADASAVVVAEELAGPTWVAARSLAPPPFSPRFYEDYDAVEVRWGRADSDLQATADVLAVVAARKLPLVVSYRVVRAVEADVRVVGHPAAGSTTFRDRVPLSALARGVRYSVEAVGAAGERAAAPETCRASALIRRVLSEDLRLARAGAAHLAHPTRVEREARASLVEPAVLAHALADFQARQDSEQRALKAAWWQSAPQSQRVVWLHAWPTYVSPGERASWLAQAPSYLSERDRPWAMLELWLRDQPPEVRQEIDRTWDLLTQTARRAALDAWLSTLNREHRAWVEPRLAGSEAAQTMRQARVMAWWHSRDARDREFIETWWLEEPSATRAQAVGEWLRPLPEVTRAAVRWPDWEQRSEREREALFVEPPPLSSGLMPDLLAWLRWRAIEETGGAALAEVIAADVGLWSATSARVRFATRPLDARLGFALPIVAPATLAAIVAAVYGLWVRRRRRRNRSGGVGIDDRK